MTIPRFEEDFFGNRDSNDMMSQQRPDFGASNPASPAFDGPAWADDSEDGWLSPAPDAPVRTSPPAPLLDEDDWLDDEEDDDDDEADASDNSGSPGRSERGNTGQTSPLMWVALIIAGFLIIIGVAVLLKPAEAPVARDVRALAAADALDRGRNWATAGKASLSTSDPELAVSQLRSAVAKLKEGGAPIGEIREAQKLFAKALVWHGDLEEGYAVWTSLKKNVPSWKVEAGKALAKVDIALRGKAQDLQLEAEGALKSGQYDIAEAKARESLKLYEEHGGSRQQLGLANGSLGYAYLERGRKSSARESLERANSLYPQGGYIAALQALRPQTPDYVEDATPEVSVQTAPVSATIDGPAYPTNTGVTSAGPRAQNAPAAQLDASTSAAPPKRPAHVYVPPKPRPKPPRRSDTLKTYTDQSKKR